MAANLDKAESSLSSVSDVAYLRAIDASGNSVKISKADLASVLGGEFSIANSTAKQMLAYGFVPEYLVDEALYDDFNSYTAHGIFAIQNAYDKANAPSNDGNVINHGFLMNFAWEKVRSTHIFFSAYPKMAIYMRRFDGDSWSPWIKFNPQ